MTNTAFLARKDPDASLDMGFDWSNWLGTDSGGNDEVIIASRWFCDDNVVRLSAEEFTDTTASVRISGGTAGETYYVTNRITTSVGQIDDRTIRVSCQET